MKLQTLFRKISIPSWVAFLVLAGFEQSTAQEIFVSSGSPLVNQVSTLHFSSDPPSYTTKTVTIRNDGTAPLTGLAVSLAGEHADDFPVNSSAMAASLAPGESTSFSVTLSPSAPGSRQAALSIASNDADENPFVIALSGTYYGTYFWEDFAGSISFPAVSGVADGTGTAARFKSPGGIACDSGGNVYVADTFNHTIRKITAAGVVTTLAGQAGVPGSANGTGRGATFDKPHGIALDSAGNLYVADTTLGLVRRITSGGAVTTLAAGFAAPEAIAVDRSGTVYLANTGDHTIRSVSQKGSVTLLAGMPGQSGTADGAGAAARFLSPSGIAVDGNGVVYVADANSRIRKITGNVVTTIANQGTSARGIAVDAGGNVFVTSENLHQIRIILPSGWSSTIGGSSKTGNAGGLATSSLFWYPAALAITPEGRLFVAGGENHNIMSGRLVVPGPGGLAMENAATKLPVKPLATEEFHRVAINSPASRAFTIRNLGTQTITGLSASIPESKETGFTISAPGLPNSLAPGGSANFTIVFAPWQIGDLDTQLRIATSRSTANPLIINLSGTGVPPFVWTGHAGSGTDPAEPGNEDGPRRDARFHNPNSVAVDGGGNVFVADSNNHTIRMITPAGLVTTLAGKPGVSGFADGGGGEARFNSPDSIAVGPGGVLYVADRLNGRIRKVTPDGEVTTFANVSSPTGIAVSASGVVYVSSGVFIRKISPQGAVTVLAGGSSGNADGFGYWARFSSPRGLALDSGGNLYVTDLGDRKIRKITPAGLVTTFAGSGTSGITDGQGTAARFTSPAGIAIDAQGDLLVTDGARIRKISPSADVTTVGGGSSGNREGIGAHARFTFSGGIASAAGGAILVAGNGNHNIMSGAPRTVSPEIAVLPAGDMSLANGAGVVHLGATPGTPVSLTFQIRNDGLAMLQNLSVALAGGSSADFGLDTTATTPGLLYGGLTTFAVTFAPSSLGPKAATLSVASNDPDENPFVIELTGTGLSSREGWRLAHFNFWDNSGTAADLADPDQDGLENLLEFAFNLDPEIPEVPTVQGGGGSRGLPLIHAQEGILRIEYIRRKGPAADGIRYQPQFSSALDLGWIDASGPETVAEIDADWERVTVDDPESGMPRRFGRVMVAAP